MSGSSLNVAIVGSGPAGFYAAEALLKQQEHNVRVDMIERLPTPYGLVRSGVTPDHQKIKNVAKIFEDPAVDLLVGEDASEARDRCGTGA